MKECKSFAPRVNAATKILILGSMPGIKSLKERQYYAHPQNRFWKVLGVLCKNSDLHNFEYKIKIKTLLDNGIGLWDVIKSCEREGSLDSNIENESANDISGLLKKYKNIKIICCNGNKAYSAFCKYFPNIAQSYTCYKMPSTSPANASYSFERLLGEWEKILN